MASGGWQRETRHGRGYQFTAALEELAELLADLAAAGFAFFPLVGVDAQGGVGLAVAEPALHVDDGEVECDQHAGVAVAEVVQRRLGHEKISTTLDTYGHLAEDSLSVAAQAAAISLTDAFPELEP